MQSYCSLLIVPFFNNGYEGRNTVHCLLFTVPSYAHSYGRHALQTATAPPSLMAMEGKHRRFHLLTSMGIVLNISYGAGVSTPPRS